MLKTQREEATCRFFFIIWILIFFLLVILKKSSRSILRAIFFWEILTIVPRYRTNEIKFPFHSRRCVRRRQKSVQQIRKPRGGARARRSPASPRVDGEVVPVRARREPRRSRSGSSSLSGRPPTRDDVVVPAPRCSISGRVGDLPGSVIECSRLWPHVVQQRLVYPLVPVRRAASSRCCTSGM